jgi:hypothetical protein
MIGAGWMLENFFSSNFSLLIGVEDDASGERMNGESVLP